MLDHGTTYSSPGGSFGYMVLGPCCRLYDREQLPWPSCSLFWRGRQPSWNRTGSRFVADMATRQHPSYAVRGRDRGGAEWEAVVTDFVYALPEAERKWWAWRGPACTEPPAAIEDMSERLENGQNW
jgi:hypothetical protein